MFGSIKDQLTQELAEIEAAGLYKRERVIPSAQDAEITLDDGSSVLNFVPTTTSIEFTPSRGRGRQTGH